FFQAEDGIRDRNVTGVQTCALPIFITWMMSKTVNEFSSTVTDRKNVVPLSCGRITRQNLRQPEVPSISAASSRSLRRPCRADRRSEERRVGKERRDGGTQ